MDGSGAGRGEVFTIGHSNHELGEFLGLLKRQGIEALVDVRSHPRSRYAPRFDAAALRVCPSAGRGVLLPQ